MKLRCLAIDDEPLALELLEDNISKVPFLERVASCSNPIEAFKILETESIDLIFLDIQMPGLTGLQFIQSLSKKPLFILITAYEKYALESYNLDVVDYLVKPVALDRFVRACHKAKELFELRNTPAIPTGNTNLTKEYMFVNADYSLVKINFEDVLYVEGLKDYVKIVLKTNPAKPVITRTTLKQMEEDLPNPPFLRVHKSFIINKDQVTTIRKTGVTIGNVEIPVSENYKEVVEEIWKNKK